MYQLEFFYRRYSDSAATAHNNTPSLSAMANNEAKEVNSVINVDVEGRCNDQGGGKGDYDHANTGTLYSVDVAKMVQTNMKSKYERKVGGVPPTHAHTQMFSRRQKKKRQAIFFLFSCICQHHLNCPSSKFPS